MNKAVIIAVLSFWAIVVALLTAGFISSENQRLIESVKGAQNVGQIESGLDVVDNNDMSTPDGINMVSGVQVGQHNNAPIVSNVVMDQVYVAKHRTPSDCWLVISGNIYNVTEYIPFHPGGQSQITDNCGTDATVLFTSDANGGHKHSSMAKDLLSRYFVASLGTVISQKVVQGEQSTSTKNQENNTSLSVERKTLSASIFSSGDRVQTTAVLKVRQTPSTTGSLIGSQSVGVKGVVTGSSVFASGYWWVPVRYDNGMTGWSVEDYLVRQNVTNTQITQNTQIPQTENNTQQNNEQSQTQNNQNIQQTTGSGYTAATVAQHASANDCWVIINGNVYDLTQYVPFHPGGQNQILQYCGADGSTGFNTRGGTGTHSTSARNQLANYLLGPFGAGTTNQNQIQDPVVNVDTTAPTISITSPANGVTVSGTISVQASASDAGGISSVSFKMNNILFSTDTSAPYSASLNTASYTNGTYTVSVTATDTAGNAQTVMRSITIQNTVQQTTPPQASSGGYTVATVAQHASANDCWLIISGNVYDVTQYIPFHPGGQSRITNNCGTDATTLFNSNANGGHNHSTSARNQLANYLLGPLTTETITTTPPPAADAPICTSFTYSTWGSCLASGTQTRTVTSSSPAGCTGGTPITTQSCVYTPPQSPDQAYRDTILSQYPGANITKLKVEDNGTAEFKFTHNGTAYEGKMNAQYQITSIQP